MLSHIASLVLIAALTALGVLTGTLAVVLVRARSEARRVLIALHSHARWLEAHTVGHTEEAPEATAAAAADFSTAREQRDAAVSQALMEADAARERLQNVLDSTAMTYVTLDREWRVTYVNKPGEQLLGRSTEALVGRRLWDLYPEQIGNEFYQRLQRAMADRGPAEVEWYNAVADQSFIVHAYPTREGLALHYEDVTERKRAEELRVRLASIVESSEDAIISMDIDGTIQSWNEGARMLHGYTADEAIGCSLTMLAPDRDARELTALLRRLRDGVRIEPVETVRRRKDGSTVQVFLTVSSVRDEQGRIIGASNIARDMSAMREAERALMRWAAMFEHAGWGVAIARGDTEEIEAFNPAFASMHGYSIDELRGRSLSSLCAPDARGDLAVQTEIALELGHHAYQSVHVRRDGSRFPVLIDISVFRDDDGAVLYRAINFQDNSAARRTEDVLRFLADAGSSLAASLDLDATLERVVREAVPFFGDYCVVDLLSDDGKLARAALAHADPACQATLERLRAHPPKRGQHMLFDRVLDSGQPDYSSDPAIVALVNQSRTPELPEILLLELRAHAYMCVPLIAHEKTLGVITFVYSNSNRQYVENDVPLAKQIASRAALAIDNARLYRETEEANRAKSDFLAVMSHELRTPLNAIGGYAQLMELGLRGPVTEQQKEDLARIRRSQLHLLAMVNDVLNFVRLEAGHARLDIADVDVSDALNAAIDMVAPQIHARGLTFEQSHAPGLRARADREKLQQIVLNLLSNSIKYTEPGGHVQLTSRLVDGAVQIQVRDNGRGIPGGKLQTIFEPFVRLDIGLTRTTEGTGLGLSISRDLARALGGDLVAESELGLGSIFTLTLPEFVDPYFQPAVQLQLHAAENVVVKRHSQGNDFR